MAGNRARRSHAKRPQHQGTPPVVPRSPAAPTETDADQAVTAALEEIQSVLDMPLSELVDTEEERAEAEELTRQARVVPAMARLRELVDFVGRGRPATQAGNLKIPDAVAMARRLGWGDDVSGEVRSMDDLAGVAHVFRWGVAAELLAWRGSRIVAGPRARDLERDALAAWFKAAITLLEHGLLDGFRRVWRKSYVELLDAGVGGLLAAIVDAGGAVALTAIEDRLWGQVAASYGYDPEDGTERRHVEGLVRVMVSELADIGTVARRHDDVVLTGLGSALAAAIVISGADDSEELDLVDTDA